MSNDSSTTPAWALAVFAVAIGAVLWTPPCYQVDVSQQAKQMRAGAWDQAIAQADSLDQKRILAFARSKAEGRDCRSESARREHPTADFSIQRAVYLKATLDLRIEGEQACLEQLKGEVLAGMPAGRAGVLDLQLPR